MKMSPHVRLAPRDGIGEVGFESSPEPYFDPLHDTGLLRRAIARTRTWLLGEQHEDGYWVGELEGDTILESEYILLLAYLEKEHTDEAKKAACYLIEKQLDEGGWPLYPGGKIDVSGSVKAYFALKLTGHDPGAEYMQRARRAILAAGGADRVNSFTRFYLALLGQIAYDDCPEVPPEAVLLPSWFPISMYHISAWSRTIVVPLSIMSALRPVRQVDPALGIRELFIKAPGQWPPLRSPGQEQSFKARLWERLFRGVDGALKLCRRAGVLPLRRAGIRAAERWMLQRFEGSDGLGAIFPPIVWSIIALDCLGYSRESPEVQSCLAALDSLRIETEDTLRLQPCQSPVWDTAITLRALDQCGTPRDNPAIQQSVRWLLDKEIRRVGDWSKKVDAEPGGWCFEHNNEFYPDLDDTAMVLMALRNQLDQVPRHDALLPAQLYLVAGRTADNLSDARSKAMLLERIGAAGHRGLAWMLAMQNRDGGWGAFDRNSDHELLCHVPFADHNAMIDPSTPDLTARVLEALGQWGYEPGHPAVDRAAAYLRNTQEPDGSWYGRWGVNYLYGTWQVLVGLAAVGVPHDDPAVVAGANWLLAHQQENGGWGESADSYADISTRGTGPTTASQTAWAVMGLLAAGKTDHPGCQRGIDYLVTEQDELGLWDEPEFTGTGFPQVFYLRYHMYPVYFPLLALSQWAVARGTAKPAGRPAELRVVREPELVAAEA